MIGSTIVLFIMRLGGLGIRPFLVHILNSINLPIITFKVGSPFLFETALLVLSIVHLVVLRTGHSLPFGAPPSYLPVSTSEPNPNSESSTEEAIPNPKDTTNKPSPILMLVVSAIFALTAYVDVILHLTQVIEKEEVQFWATVMFFSSVSLLYLYLACLGRVIDRFVVPRPSNYSHLLD